MVEIVVSDGSEPVREASVKVNIYEGATGEFIFKYYIDGTLQEDMTETKDISLIDKIEWTFENSESNASGFKGLSAAIMNPYSAEMMKAYSSGSASSTRSVSLKLFFIEYIYSSLIQPIRCPASSG